LPSRNGVEIEEEQEEVPLVPASRIYLDHNATTPLDPRVKGEMVEVLGAGLGNPSSLHASGQAARRIVDRARERVARFLGADPAEIVFCGSGTEADNLAILGAAAALGPPASLAIALSAVEHPAVHHPVELLERQGARVARVRVDGEGRLDLGALAAALDGRTSLVSVMLANNDVGTIQPVEEAARIARAASPAVVVHTDAVQAAGKIPVDVRRLGVDLLSISGHKLRGPQGVGALFVRRGVRLSPILLGGGQERGRRAGTENVAALAGLGLACELAAAELEANRQRCAALARRLEEALLERLPFARPRGRGAERLPNTVNLTLPGLDGEALILSLDLAGVAASAGSACASGTAEPPHTLLAMGVSPEEARGSLRLSLGPSTTPEEVEAAEAIIVATVERLRSARGIARGA
jgi:cysteine desulfurase